MPKPRRTLARLLAATKLTEQDVFACKSAMIAVWDYIAYDTLQATAEEKGKDINTVTVDKNTVIELVLDADRFSEELKRKTHRASPALLEVISRWTHASDDNARDFVYAVAYNAFTYSRYGM